MSPPGDYSRAACRRLGLKELEATFWYPGPQHPFKPPTDFAQAAWDKAKQVCRQCPLERTCLRDHLIEHHGVWGGTDPYERYKLRRRVQRAERFSAPEPEPAPAEPEPKPAAKPAERRPVRAVEFPAGRPSSGDAWVWRDGMCHPAHYLAQTPDGAHFFMKHRLGRRPVRRWFPAAHVDLRTTVAPVVREWAGRDDARASESFAA